MAILDWIKELPLSVIYKERLLDSERQIVVLEEKVLILEQENIELKTILNQCEEDRRTLEKQIEQKLLQSHGGNLDEIKEKILSAFIENERLSPEMISEFFEIKTALADYHLHGLGQINMAIEMSAFDDQVFWGITQPGRDYLVSHGLLA